MWMFRGVLGAVYSQVRLPQCGTMYRILWNSICINSEQAIGRHMGNSDTTNIFIELIIILGSHTNNRATHTEPYI